MSPLPIKQERVTVGIVGGGVAGLALANMLDKSGISFALLEAHDLASPAGTSIGMMPNGLRILDQLDVMEELDKFAYAHEQWEHRDGRTGHLYAESKALRGYPELFGYNGYFMDRVDILRAVRGGIKNQSQLHDHAKVTNIKQVHDGAVIETAQGISVHCQIVAGADGVHSAVRKAIQRVKPESIIADDYLTAKTTCVFGISAAFPQFPQGSMITVYQEQASLLAMSGHNGRLYWFIFHHLPEPLKYGERHHFSEQDIQEVYPLVANVHIRNGLSFSEIFAQREYTVMLPIEQGISENWHAERMVLLGDATHKMTPHAAMGANLALEDAASFVNRLRELQAARSSPQLGSISVSELTAMFEAHTAKQRTRAEPLFELASSSETIQLKVGPVSEAFLRELPNTKDSDALQRAALSYSQAEMLNDWYHSSPRIRHYTAQAEKIRAGKLLAEGALAKANKERVFQKVTSRFPKCTFM